MRPLRSRLGVVVSAGCIRAHNEGGRPARKRRALCSGISGGQAKRVNIGIAVVVNPRVLFLDEPTSGLDSYTANEVMTVVKGLASENVTICATIHSPSPYTFELFDRLMVLVRGETVYFGANGQTMLDYFKSIEGTVRPPQTALDNNNIGNNADYLTDLVVGADREGRAHEYADAFEQSDLKRSMDAIVHRNAKVRRCRIVMPAVHMCACLGRHCSTWSPTSKQQPRRLRHQRHVA